MTNPLHALAKACGLAREWRDVEGREQKVSDEVLTAILGALGHPSESEAQIAHSLGALKQREQRLPAMLVADAGQAIALPVTGTTAELVDESGMTRPLTITGKNLSPVGEPGYYDMVIDGQPLKLAVAPRHCPLPKLQDRRPWGVSLQIPSLRGSEPRDFGNFLELSHAVNALAHKGADAIAINPVHALFPGHGEGFSPYSPSSRIYLNSAMGDPALVGLPPLAKRDGGELIDWEAALPARLQALRAIFDELQPTRCAEVLHTCAGDGEGLRRHALFDALDSHFRPRGAHGWRAWPATYHDPAGEAAANFAAEYAEEVEFHTFLQWLARESLSQVQKAARDAGMAIGLINDLAVGVDPSGSDAWAMRDAMLTGLTIGAPPDPLGPLGQNWSITGFSPEGLQQSGYAPWIAMLRNAMAAGGGLRIDHAFGLSRLWVIPEGGGAGDGAYLTFPFEDLIRLATLEAHLAQSLIIAEDLGTAPHGFTQAVTERQMLGMRVLWFERAEDHGFIGAQDYEPLSVGMTGTHDTVTVAGWWSGRDLDWAERLGRLPTDVSRAKADEIRDWDRGLLWSTIGERGPRPAPTDTDPVVDAAIEHIARTPTVLAIVPLEDLLGEEEQPNLPGTVSEHPNWRRRYEAPLHDVTERPQIAARCASLSNARRS
ncbi:4-alpha-glucanotransferase [Altererythrobacter sp. BO-6]|uniref:4-alpha-glucanotransferase n=1 Tax=Altererythrobacter sp. BO-6 TaxID=2604537 RepID=UPI0013E0F13E|nr:4-alpha-glucanotransferase [Altererythrobacter sp. BO-6]QIG53180.1 4-alpha-glucanotransferase [Altererythrobacter sp. BO-6]